MYSIHISKINWWIKIASTFVQQHRQKKQEVRNGANHLPCSSVTFGIFKIVKGLFCILPHALNLPVEEPNEKLNSLFRDQWRFSVEFTGNFSPLPFPPNWSDFLFYVLDSSYLHYFGNSYLEFPGIDLSTLNNITVRFQTTVAQGTILYVDQGPANGDFFFMKLFILDGILQVG